MGPPPDNCRQQYHWSLFAPVAEALFHLGEPLAVPIHPSLNAADPDPRANADAWLREAGFGSPGQAREALSLPAGRQLVVGWDGLDPLQCPALLADPTLPAGVTPLEAVRAALVLSLSSVWLYHPDGPLLWTAHRLRRRIRLVSLRGNDPVGIPAD